MWLFDLMCWCTNVASGNPFSEAAGGNNAEFHVICLWGRRWIFTSDILDRLPFPVLLSLFSDTISLSGHRHYVIDMLKKHPVRGANAQAVREAGIGTASSAPGGVVLLECPQPALKASPMDTALVPLAGGWPGSSATLLSGPSSITWWARLPLATLSPFPWHGLPHTGGSFLLSVGGGESARDWGFHDFHESAWTVWR